MTFAQKIENRRIAPAKRSVWALTPPLGRLYSVGVSFSVDKAVKPKTKCKNIIFNKLVLRNTRLNLTLEDR